MQKISLDVRGRLPASEVHRLPGRPAGLLAERLAGRLIICVSAVLWEVRAAAAQALGEQC